MRAAYVVFAAMAVFCQVAFGSEPSSEPSAVPSARTDAPSVQRQAPVKSVVMPIKKFMEPMVELKAPNMSPVGEGDRVSGVPSPVEPAMNCPPGFQYEESTGKCWSLPNCPDGGTFDVNIRKCVKNPVVKCSEGFTYNPKTDKCVAPPIRESVRGPGWATGSPQTEAK